MFELLWALGGLGLGTFVTYKIMSSKATTITTQTGEIIKSQMLICDLSKDRSRYEEWDQFTPPAHMDDRFTCNQGCLWSRLHGDFGHGAAPKAWHSGIRVIRYINKPIVLPEPKVPEYGEGKVR